MRIGHAMGLAVCSLVVTAAAARANPAEWSSDVTLDLVPGSSADAGPVVRATIVGRPIAQASDLTLTDVGKLPIRATSVTPYREGTEAITIAVVVQGGEIFMGNDDIEPEDSPARYPGALKGIAEALDHAHLAAFAPAGSKAFAITYGDGAQLKMPASPLDELDGKVFGTQRDYRNKLGTDLVAGLDLAVAMLEQANTARRALIVIGDGNDTNNDAAVGELAQLRKRAAIDGIETFSIIYKSPVSEDGNVISRMIANTKTVTSTDAIAAKVVSIGTHLAGRYYATFPTTELDHDGRMHDLTIAVDGQPMDPVALVIPGAAPSATSFFTLWRQIAIGLVLASLCVLALYVRGRLARTALPMPNANN